MKKILWILLFVALVAGFYWGLKWYRNSLPLPEGYVSMEFPLKDGRYMIVQSGKFGNIHTSPVEKYALDIVKEPPISSLFKFRKAALADDVTYGTKIYSPCKGYVKDLRNGVDDQPIGIKDPSMGGGNYLIIGCDGFDVMLAHIKKDTFLVNVKDQVSVGQELAQIGNSGNTDGPHLHLMAYIWNEDNTEKIPVPMAFDGKLLYRYDIVSY